MTDSSQTVTGTLNLDSFGNQVGSTGSSSDPYMYEAQFGYRNDGDAGLTLVGARYYDSQVGRFASRDTWLDQAPYTYCDGSPIDYTDPSGHDWGAWDAIKTGCEIFGGGLAIGLGIYEGWQAWNDLHEGYKWLHRFHNIRRAPPPTWGHLRPDDPGPRRVDPGWPGGAAPGQPQPIVDDGSYICPNF